MKYLPNHRFLLLATVCLVSGCGPTGPGMETYLPAHAPAATSRDSSLAREIANRINELRASAGKGTIRVDDQLSAVARIHSHRMASGLSPIGTDGSESRRRAACMVSASELVAVFGNRGPGTAKKFVDFWAADEDTRSTLTDRGPACGIGVSHSTDGRAFVTLLME